MSDASHPYFASPPTPARARSSLTHGLAFAWGLAEATFFFIVPDVLLTRVALRDFHASVIASLWSVAGALVVRAIGRDAMNHAEQATSAVPTIAAAVQHADLLLAGVCVLSLPAVLLLRRS